MHIFEIKSMRIRNDGHESIAQRRVKLEGRNTIKSHILMKKKNTRRKISVQTRNKTRHYACEPSFSTIFFWLVGLEFVLLRHET